MTSSLQARKSRIGSVDERNFYFVLLTEVDLRVIQLGSCRRNSPATDNSSNIIGKVAVIVLKNCCSIAY